MINSQRAKMVEIIAKTSNYDISTIRVTADGQVTAKLDANKTFNGPHNDRVLVGYAEEILRRESANITATQSQ
jgi:hypothetical protein